MADLELQTWYCEKCKRTMSIDQFYQSNNTTKYPDRYLNQCKKCLTMHVDNWNPDTFLWILQEIDVPYVSDEWNKLLAKYSHDRSGITGLTIIGRYLSKMKLKQWKNFRWSDNEYLQELHNHQIEEAMKRQGYDGAQIDEVIKKATFSIPDKPLEEPSYAEPASEFAASGDEDYFNEQYGDDGGIGEELTDEDRLYLRVKWGKGYRPEEWVWLEKLYSEMMESYDIQFAGHVDILKMVCKASLKSNQLLDIGDIEGAQKAVKMYDALMRSGNFTAVQNKEDNSEGIDSIGQLVAICEKDGFIPRYYVDQPKDKVDRVIEDMQQYTHDLVTEELGLGNLIENAIKSLQMEQESIKSSAETTEQDEEDKLFDYEQPVMTDEDYIDFQQFEETLTNEDIQQLVEEMEDEEENVE